jgi:hypothetical protein
MTLLSDGSGRILVAGGNNADTVFSNASLYNPHTDKWKTVHPMKTTRSSHIAIPLARGRVLVAGGSNLEGALSSCEIYDPSSDTWSLDHPLVEAVTASRGIIFTNGNTLLIGGIVNTSTGNYEPLASCEAFTYGGR